jgi:O-antigen ligase
MNNTNKNLFSLISLISLSLMFCLPFIVSYHKLPEANYYNQVVAFVFGILSLLVFIKPVDSKIGFPPLAMAPLTLCFVLLVQWFSGVGASWQETVLAALYLVWAGLIMLVVVRLKELYTSERIIIFLAYALLIGGMLNVVVVFMQLIGTDDFFWIFPRTGKNYTGNLAQVNLLTDYLSLSMVSLFYLYVKGRLKINVVLILVPIYLIALSLAGSRMSWLYIMLLAVSFYLLGRNNTQPSWQHKSKMVLLLPLLYALVQFVLPFALELISQGSSALIPPAPAERVAAFVGNHSKRLDLIKEGLDIFSHYPLLGVGWGQYVWYDLLFADSHSNHAGYITHTHNLFLQLMAETGFFGFLTIFIGVVYWIIKLMKQPNLIESWWVLLTGGIIFVHSMLEYPLWNAHFLGVFVVVVALADKRLEIKVISPFMPRIVSIVVMVASLYLLGLTSYQYMQIEYWINYYPVLSKQQRLAMLKQMTVMHQKTLMVEPLHAVLTRAYGLLPMAQAPLQSKIDKYESLLRYAQAKEDIYRYVLLLAIDGQAEKAKLFLKRAYIRQPEYAKVFEKQLEEGVKAGNLQLLVLQAELQLLQRD